MFFPTKVGFRSYEEQKPVPQGRKRGQGDKTRGKTILEQLSDTDKPPNEEEPPSLALWCDDLGSGSYWSLFVWDYVILVNRPLGVLFNFS